MNLTEEEIPLESLVDWIEKRVEEASKTVPVPEAITSMLKNKLNGEIRERPLNPSEIASIARTFLKEMEDNSSKGTPQ